MSTSPDHPSAVRAVGISGSPLPYSSKSRILLVRALSRLAAARIQVQLIELALLPAEGLLGRRKERAVEEALRSVAEADIVAVSTPIYRATYSGLLKLFFDLLPQGALAGKVGLSIATGGGPGHQLALDHGLAPLFASLGGVVVPSGVYGSDQQFTNGSPEPALIERADRAADEALSLSAAFARRRAPAPALAER